MAPVSEKQRQVAAGLEPALEVAAAGEFAQLGALDGTAVPLDPKVLPNVSQRPVAHGRLSPCCRICKPVIIRSRTRLALWSAAVDISI